VQQRLREEVMACPTPTPSMDDLNALSYLDAVVRETLRLHPAIPGTARIANKDEDIPVGNGYTDRNGVKRDSVR
jgi:cytochrome P450